MLVFNQRDKGVHNFPKGINPKVNVITWLEFELVPYEVAFRHINNYIKGTAPLIKLKKIYWVKISIK